MLFSNINIHLFTLINNMTGKNILLDRAMVLIAKYIIYIVPIYLLYLWFIGRGKEDKRKSLYIFLVIIVSLLIGHIISNFYYHPRPFAMGIGKELLPHASDSSFPSDHATVIFAISFALFFLKDIKNGIIFFILATLVGFARIFCGVHFPFDILGALVVALCGTAITFIFKKQLDFLFTKTIQIYEKILSTVLNRKVMS